MVGDVGHQRRYRSDLLRAFGGLHCQHWSSSGSRERKCSAWLAASPFFIFSASEAAPVSPASFSAATIWALLSSARKGYQPSVSTSHEGQTEWRFPPHPANSVFTTRFILALYTIYGAGGAESHQCHQGCAIERKEGGHILSPVFRQQGFKTFFLWMAETQRCFHRQVLHGSARNATLTLMQNGSLTDVVVWKTELHIFQTIRATAFCGCLTSSA